MDYQRAKKVILEILENDLPDYLVYHSVAHTKDVVEAAARIARTEGVEGDELTLLLTAAWFHDSGYIFGASGHELMSCEIAARYLPDCGYTPGQIAKVQEIIMATRMPQTPKDHLGAILADADLDYLGRDDFFTIDKYLYRELKLTGQLSGESEWNKMQKDFLEGHSYFTETSKLRRRPQKLKNLQMIQSLIK